jgi:hypothetical protein
VRVVPKATLLIYDEFPSRINSGIDLRWGTCLPAILLGKQNYTVALMASTASVDETELSIYLFSAEEAKERIAENGAHVVQDAAAGDRLVDFAEKKQLPIRTLDGLNFCAQNSLYDKVG